MYEVRLIVRMAGLELPRDGQAGARVFVHDLHVAVRHGRPRGHLSIWARDADVRRRGRADRQVTLHVAVLVGRELARLRHSGRNRGFLGGPTARCRRR